LRPDIRALRRQMIGAVIEHRSLNEAILYTGNDGDIAVVQQTGDLCGKIIHPGRDLLRCGISRRVRGEGKAAGCSPFRQFPTQFIVAAQTVACHDADIKLHERIGDLRSAARGQIAEPVEAGTGIDRIALVLLPGEIAPFNREIFHILASRYLLLLRSISLRMS